MQWRNVRIPLQRFAWAAPHFAISLVRHRSAVEPVYPVRVQNQLVFALNIVETRHFLGTDDRQLLLFERMRQLTKYAPAHHWQTDTLSRRIHRP